MTSRRRPLQHLMTVERKIKVIGFSGTRNLAPMAIKADAGNPTKWVRQIPIEILGHRDMEIRIISA